MGDSLQLEPAAGRRILRRLVGQTYAIVVCLVALGLTLNDSPIPLWVRALASLAVLLLGAVMAEVFVRLAVRRYPTMQLPTSSIVIAAVVASLVGFTVAFGVQQLLGYPTTVTWVVLVEALVSAPVWLVFIGSITAARWRYQASRELIEEELTQVAQARSVERGALRRARESVAQSVRPSLVQLRGNIDAAMATGVDRPAAATELRHNAANVLRPLSHQLYAQGRGLQQPRRRPVQFLLTVMSTQPFRPGLVSVLYLATALPTNVGEYGVAEAVLTLTIDVVFIMAILGGANWFMRRRPTAHLWIYLGTLIVIHGLPLLLTLPEVAESDPQYNGWAKVVEIAASLLLIVGTSSLTLFAARREADLAVLHAELQGQQVAELAEAAVLAEAARELGVLLHGPVQSAVLASAAALERAVTDDDTARAHTVLSEAAATIDAALSSEDFNDGVSLEGRGDDQVRDLPELLVGIAEPWQEICEVHTAVAPETTVVVGPVAESIGAIVREAIANAFRHGGATHVDVRVTAADPWLVVNVTDNGHGPGPKNWGLGLTIIDRASRGHWTLVRDRDRTLLTAQVPRDIETTF